MPVRTRGAFRVWADGAARCPQGSQTATLVMKSGEPTSGHGIAAIEPRRMRSGERRAGLERVVPDRECTPEVSAGRQGALSEQGR